MYNKQELIDAVVGEIENLVESYKDDEEVTEIDIRLQLFDDTYYIDTGDSQYDTDHRGSWAYGSIVINDYDEPSHWANYPLRIRATDPNDYLSIATDMVEGALDDYEQPSNESILTTVVTTEECFDSLNKMSYLQCRSFLQTLYNIAFWNDEQHQYSHFQPDKLKELIAKLGELQ